MQLVQNFLVQILIFKDNNDCLCLLDKGNWKDVIRNIERKLLKS